MRSTTRMLEIPVQKLVYVKIQGEQSQDEQNRLASNYMVLDLVQ